MRSEAYWVRRSDCAPKRNADMGLLRRHLDVAIHSSHRSIASIFPSRPATLMASSMFTRQKGQAVTMTSAPARRAISTRTTPMRISSSGS